MYGPIWRALPGAWPVKMAQLLVLVLVVVAVCFLWVFPAVAPHMPFNGNTVDDTGSVATSSVSTSSSGPSSSPGEVRRTPDKP